MNKVATYPTLTKNYKKSKIPMQFGIQDLRT